MHYPYELLSIALRRVFDAIRRSDNFLVTSQIAISFNSLKGCLRMLLTFRVAVLTTVKHTSIHTTVEVQDRTITTLCHTNIAHQQAVQTH